MESEKSGSHNYGDAYSSNEFDASERLFLINPTMAEWRDASRQPSWGVAMYDSLVEDHVFIPYTHVISSSMGLASDMVSDQAEPH